VVAVIVHGARKKTSQRRNAGCDAVGFNRVEESMYAIGDVRGMLCQVGDTVTVAIEGSYVLCIGRGVHDSTVRTLTSPSLILDGRIARSLC